MGWAIVTVFIFGASFGFMLYRLQVGYMLTLNPPMQWEAPMPPIVSRK